MVKRGILRIDGKSKGGPGDCYFAVIFKQCFKQLAPFLPSYDTKALNLLPPTGLQASIAPPDTSFGKRPQNSTSRNEESSCLPTLYIYLGCQCRKKRFVYENCLPVVDVKSDTPSPWVRSSVTVSVNAIPNNCHLKDQTTSIFNFPEVIAVTCIAVTPPFDRWRYCTASRRLFFIEIRDANIEIRA